MLKNHNIINALPLVADALGRKYGVKVIIGGKKACTNGATIHLPALPVDSDETLLNAARGYIDHEAAHLRFTDFGALRSANLDKPEKFVWNALEDFMAERKLGNSTQAARETSIG